MELEGTSDGVSGLRAMLERFGELAGELGYQAERAADVNGAAQALAALAAEWGATEAIVSSELADAAPRLLDALVALGIGWATAGAPETTADAALGIGLGKLAVAETASVVMAEPTLEDRAVGMLANGQVMVCRSADLVPDLDAAGSVLRDFALRGVYAALVTGPSRTADIERVLTIGVQGPARVAVLFVDDLD